MKSTVILAMAVAVVVIWLNATQFADAQSTSEGLDLSAFKITFDEEFNELSVSARGPNTRWIAHTPWNGDFGDAQFSDPEPGFPFTVKDGVLRIEARKGVDGRWRSGLLCSRDGDGVDAEGFAQKYGYFEMRAKLPPGPGVWPAFWLEGVDKSTGGSEIDVMEQYGRAPDQFQVGTHIFRPGGKDETTGQVISTEHDIMQTHFNTYGVLIEPEWMSFYFNRSMVWRTPTERQFRVPFYILLDLALGSGWPIDKTINPSFLEVDYVKVFSR